MFSAERGYKEKGLTERNVEWHGQQEVLSLRGRDRQKSEIYR